MTAPSTERIDDDLAILSRCKDSWAGVAIPERIAYLRRVHDAVAEIAPEWVAAAVRAKGIAEGSPTEGEEWLSGPYGVLTWIAAVSETLEALAAGADPLAGFPVRQRADGQTVVRVFPHDIPERLLLNGVTADVWMEPGVTPANLRANVAALHRDGPGHIGSGSVALVLGAGNISSIPALDVLYKLFVDGEVVLLKFNPVNDYLGPLFERAFAALAEAGFLRFAYGGTAVGEYLCRHPSVQTIHITGSERTHDAIVYGTGPDGAARKERDERQVDKPVTSELGGVGPTIVVPGPWTDADFRFQAEHIATQKLHNSGFNCIASQVLVLPEGWSGTERLVAAVRTALREAPARPTYYPGAEDRRRAVVEQYPGAEDIPTAAAARTLVVGVDATDEKAYAFTEEFFAPVLATTTLPGADAAAFLRNAVAFANDTLHGTLGANIIVHPDTAKELGAGLEDAVAALRYGTVAINAWTGVGYLTPRATWGAYPGHIYSDVQSGIGVVHNALMFDRPQKTVVRAPFRPFPRSARSGELTVLPRPPWFVTNTTAAVTARRLTAFAADGKLWRLAGIFASALRG